MATVSAWSPFGVALDITATNGGVTRISATQYTVKINSSWETYYSGAKTNYGMTASSGGGSATLNPFGTYASNGSGTFTGTYSISGNGSATKTITVTFRNFNNDNGDSATRTVTFDVTVPAWTSYTVSYNANGGSGAPSSQTKWKDQTLTLSSTKPTRTGYTFIGWGTSAADTSVDYNAGGSYTANASDTLYAIWKKTITLTYNANGGSGAPSAQSATIYNATTNNKFTISNTKPTRTGYTFLGWSTSSTATSPSYSVGGSITLSDSDILYAVWSENKLTVYYYSNYATESFAEAENVVDAYQDVVVRTATFYYDNEIPNGHWDYSQPDSATYLYRTGYTATGYWGTSNGGGILVSQSTAYNSGQEMAEAVGMSLKNGDASVNLYAQWEVNAYTFNYDANGGSGNMDFQTAYWDSAFILSNNAFKREGYKFIGWNAYRNADSKWYVADQGWLTEDEIMAGGHTKKLYQNQDELVFNISWIEGNEKIISQFTLHAVWEISGVVYIDNGTIFEPYLAYIDNGSEWELHLMYIDDGTEWNIIS